VVVVATLQADNFNARATEDCKHAKLPLRLFFAHLIESVDHLSKRAAHQQVDMSAGRESEFQYSQCCILQQIVNTY
jgi:hypothetical protein